MTKQLTYIGLASIVCYLVAVSHAGQTLTQAESPPCSDTHQQASPAAVPVEAQTSETGVGTNRTYGIRAYKDPKTGKLGPPPSQGHPAEPSPGADKAVDTQSEGLVEVPSPVPDGGVMVDLKGRFRSHAKATKGPDGKPTIHCTIGPASR